MAGDAGDHGSDQIVQRGTPGCPVVLRRIFPGLSECPRCRDLRWAAAGASKGGLVRYRRCRGCAHVYPVAAIAEERDEGGPWPRIVPR